MRSFERSATNSRPLESMARAWGTSNSPCPLPALPQALMNFPSFENFTMRAFVFSPCPSATKMSPLGATRTSDGPLKVSGPSPATPGLPSVISTFPSGLNLITVWPLPLPSLPSVTQTLPSRSANRPCGQLIMPPAKLRSPAPTRGLREASPNSLRRDRDWARHWDPRLAHALPIRPSSRRRRRRASISHDHACHFLPPQIALPLFSDSLNRDVITGLPSAVRRDRANAWDR